MSPATTSTFVLPIQFALTHEDPLTVSVREDTPLQMDFVLVSATCCFTLQIWLNLIG